MTSGSANGRSSARNATGPSAPLCAPAGGGTPAEAGSDRSGAAGQLTGPILPRGPGDRSPPEPVTVRAPGVAIRVTRFTSPAARVLRPPEVAPVPPIAPRVVTVRGCHRSGRYGSQGFYRPPGVTAVMGYGGAGPRRCDITQRGLHADLTPSTPADHPARRTGPGDLAKVTAKRKKRASPITAHVRVRACRCPRPRARASREGIADPRFFRFAVTFRRSGGRVVA